MCCHTRAASSLRTKELEEDAKRHEGDTNLCLHVSNRGPCALVCSSNVLCLSLSHIVYEGEGGSCAKGEEEGVRKGICGGCGFAPNALKTSARSARPEARPCSPRHDGCGSWMGVDDTRQRAYVNSAAYIRPASYPLTCLR